MESTSEELVDILMVDDREDNLIALEAILSCNLGYNLVRASSGMEAYELMKDHDFSIILLDVQMPGLDGFQTADLIRQVPRYAEVAILFVTAINKDDSYVYRGYESGAVDYIFKPFDPFILLSKVKVFSDLHRQRRQIKAQADRLRDQEMLTHQTILQSLELENLRRYQSLADAIPHMVWETRSDGSLIYQNRQCLVYSGMDLEACKDFGWQQMVNERDLKSLLGAWMQAIQLRQKFQLEVRLRRQDGAERWHLVMVTPQLDDHGRLQGWVGTCTDIHDHKLNERDLIAARHSAEAANLAKTEFLANMSHEIRTPLNAIMGFSDLMLDPNLLPEQRLNSLSIIRRNGDQLLKIIDEILDISKVEAGGLQIEIIEMAVPHLVAELRSFLSVQAKKKNLKIIFGAENLVPDRVLGDPNRIRQVLLNLIGNAIKFTSTGTVTTTLRWVTRSSNKTYLQFAVSDSGMGVAPELRKKIFMPFTQADTSTTRLYGGTGLGLTLSRKLCRALGGDLWLEKSEVGVGSTFIAEFAVDLYEKTNWLTSFSDLKNEFLDFAFSKESQLRGARILLAEDGEDNQLLVQHFLSGEGAEVDIAVNGVEAVEMALSREYDAVLMDIQMPLMDGYDATSRLRQAGYLKPIIAVTAHALTEERLRSFRCGFNDHLTKPLDRRQLLSHLTKHVVLEKP